MWLVVFPKVFSVVQKVEKDVVRRPGGAMVASLKVYGYIAKAACAKNIRSTNVTLQLTKYFANIQLHNKSKNQEQELPHTWTKHKRVLKYCSKEEERPTSINDDDAYGHCCCCCRRRQHHQAQ